MIKLISILCFAVLVFCTDSFTQSNNNSVLLYSQTYTNYQYAGGIVSSYDLFDQRYRKQAADDFISGDDWAIDKVSVPNYDNMTPGFVKSYNIYIYKNSQSKPDSIIYFAASQSYSQKSGVAYIELENPANLMAGHYWLSVQAVIDMQSNGNEVWGWEQIKGPVENEALYKDPGNPYGPFDWTPVHNASSSEGGTDMYFELYGSSNTVEVENNIQLPQIFALDQNYPNPFNPSTTINWQTPVSSHQILKVYDVLGNEVATLLDEYGEAGSYKVEFDASNLSSGVYLYKLQTGNFVETKKMILMK